MWKVSFIWEWLFVPEEGKDTHRRLDVDAKLDPRADVDVPVELEQTVELLLTRRADCPVLGVDHQEIIVSRVVFNTIPPIEYPRFKIDRVIQKGHSAVIPRKIPFDMNTS